MNSIADLVRKCFAAYESKDREAIESLLSDHFTFSSPLDDKISRENYFERCWPNSEHFRAFHIEQLFTDGNQAFVTYEVDLAVAMMSSAAKAALAMRLRAAVNRMMGFFMVRINRRVNPQQRPALFPAQLSGAN